MPSNCPGLVESDLKSQTVKVTLNFLPSEYLDFWDRYTLCCYCLVTKLCQTLCNPMDCNLPGSFVHGDSPDKNTGEGCHALLQGIFPTQRSNPGLLHCRLILYYLSHQGSPWILEWVAYLFSRGPSWPRNWTRVFCTAGRFFTSWATGEAQSFQNNDIQMLLFLSMCASQHPSQRTFVTLPPWVSL